MDIYRSHNDQWYICWDADNSVFQPLHSIEYPSLSGFSPDGQPEYKPIVIELPINILGDTKRWLESKDAIDIKFVMRQSSKIINEFSIGSAIVRTSHERVGRRVPKVRVVIIDYKDVENAVL